MSMRTPIWLDCDTGHDDAFAILLAARHPDVELLGVSTVYGNAALEKTTYNSRAILKAVGREDVPVYAGAARPFCRDVTHAPDIHGESGLDGTTVLPIPEVPVKNDGTAVNAMYKALMRTPKGTAWLVPTGALTNAALLFATHPDLAAHIGGLSIMGGAIGGDLDDAEPGKTPERIGNITPLAEFNVYIDPESAKSLLSNPILREKTTLVTLDLTHLFLATTKVRDDMLRGDLGSYANNLAPSPVRQLFVEILEFFAKSYAGVFGITAGPPVHDPLAVAAAFMPELFADASSSNGPQRHFVEVITDGAHASSSSSKAEVQSSQCGQTIASPAVPSGSPGIRIPRNLDVGKMWQVIEQCLDLADRATK